MFTQEELQALLQITNRVTFQGAEAETVVALKQKIVDALKDNGERTKDKK